MHGGESNCTTHVTVADAEGNVVATTQTVNGLFGACLQIPGTGMIANNYMFNFDPHPGRALSVEAGKRVFTSMAPMMVRREGRLLYALGLPGGLRIFPSAFQALVNLLDHGMTLQEAVEAPRIWTEGGIVEMEQAFPDAVEHASRSTRARGRTPAAHRRRHERHRLRKRRDADRRGLLAGGRHAGRHRRRAGPGRRAFLQHLRGRSRHD